MECLTDIIGVTQDTTCLVGASTTSKSGLYIDDNSAGRIPVRQGFWDNITEVNRLVPNAVKDALNQLRMATEKRLTRARTSILSTIGFKDNFTGTLDSAGAGHRYMVLRPKGTRGGIINFNGVVVKLQSGNFAGSIKIIKNGVTIYDSADEDNDDLPKGVTFDEPIYITYQVASDSTSNKPLNFKHTGCCGSVVTYEGYSYVGSGEVSDLGLLTWNNNDYAQGIELKVTFDCDPFIFLCNFDFDNNPFGLVFTKLVQQIARRNLLMYMLTSDNLTPYILAREEQLLLIKEYLDKDISDMLSFAPEAYDYSDCYRCDGMHRGEILI